MRVQTEEWQRFIPGVQMYKGKKTLFYNGEILYDIENRDFLIYNEEERQTWEVIIILPGVEIISELTFIECCNVERVIMTDSVRRIELAAFGICSKLAHVKLSTNLECIGRSAFAECGLTSIFIPPSCNEICGEAFDRCKKLIIFIVPQHTELGNHVIDHTALYRVSPFYASPAGTHGNINTQVNLWLKNINNDEQHALHFACSSFNPLEEEIYEIVQREAILDVFKRKNRIGLTPSQYLEANPFTEVTEQKIINRYVLEMMSEIVL